MAAIPRVGVLMAAAVLAGCDALGMAFPPIPDAAVEQYAGADAGVLTIEVTNSNCCYIEGAEQFARLEGLWEDEWRLTPDSSSITLPPGKYSLTVYERVCNGNCQPEFIGEPMHHCSARFEILEGGSILANVDFPIPKPCTMQLDFDGGVSG